MTSPYAFYQYWLNVEDASVVMLAKVFTDRGRDEIVELERQVEQQPFRRTAQKTLAADVTTLVHGADALSAVQAASAALFGKGDLRALDERTLLDATAEVSSGEVAPGASLVDALVASGLAESRNAARRLLGDGGVSLNNVKVTNVDAELSEADFLHGLVAILKRGRKSMGAVRRAE